MRSYIRPLHFQAGLLYLAAFGDSSEIVQLLNDRNKRELITPVFKQLHWLPICFQAQFKVLVIIFKALKGLGVTRLPEGLHEPLWLLRFSNEGHFWVLSVLEVKSGNTSERYRFYRQYYFAVLSAGCCHYLMYSIYYFCLGLCCSLLCYFGILLLLLYLFG